MTVVQWAPHGSPLARPPAGTVIYAVGDIHGCADLLDEMHRAIAENSARRTASRRVVVYLGDYVGRGLDTRSVLDALIERPLAGFESIYLKGNHEDLVLRLLEGDVEAGYHWLTYGGREALASYGIDAPEGEQISIADVERVREDLTTRVPPAHLRFLRSLAISHQEGGYVFVHAGVRPGVPFIEQSPRDMMWMRRRFLESDEDFGAVVVHGHSFSEEPVVRHNRIGIDTGAYFTGRLTAIAFEETTWTLLQTSAE